MLFFLLPELAQRWGLPLGVLLAVAIWGWVVFLSITSVNYVVRL